MPSDSQLHVEVRREGRATLIGLRGELDLASSAALERELERVESASPGLVVIDLSGLVFMDSTGLSLVVHAHQRAEREGWRLAPVNGPPQVQQLFAVTGLDHRLTLADSVETLLGDR